MKYHKIVLAGGNGYLGGVLAEYYRSLADQVIILSRRPAPTTGNIQTVVWDGTNPGDWQQHLNAADLLVNLCGKNVNCRYNETNKAEIISSRVVPTKLLAEVINSLSKPPKLWINVTSATIYRHAEDRPQDETSGEIGYGFSIDVCRAWENSFFSTATPGTRKIALRMSIVMGQSDGAFPRLLNLVKFGLGGKQGTALNMSLGCTNKMQPGVQNIYCNTKTFRAYSIVLLQSLCKTQSLWQRLGMLMACL